MKRLIFIFLCIPFYLACQRQTTKAETQVASSSWQLIADSVFLATPTDAVLMPKMYIESFFESEGKLFCTVNVYSHLHHYGRQTGGDYLFYITSSGQAHQTRGKSITIPREGKIPIASIGEWDIHYYDVGEWGNYLTFTNKRTERVFDQVGQLRAVFIEDSAYLSVSQSTISKITNPASGRLMTHEKTGKDNDDIYLYYENGSASQDVLWTTDAFRIYWGDADTVISGAYMLEDTMMVAMSIKGETGIYYFDGTDFHLVQELGGLSLEDNYGTLLNQIEYPDHLLIPFRDKDLQGIMHVIGRTIHLYYLHIPARPLPISPSDPTVEMVNSLASSQPLTMTEVDSVEHLFGGFGNEDNQYYTLLHDSSYLWRSYTVNKSTGFVEDVKIEHHSLGEYDFFIEKSGWKDSILSAFKSELIPATPYNSHFEDYDSPRFHLRASAYAFDNMMIFIFPNTSPQ